jgi:hypothetical protein
MPDLLSHAFIAYTLCTLLALRYEWLSPQYVTVGMAGAFIPDMAKLDLVIDNVIVGNTLGIPFNWFAIHTLGGATIAVLVGVTFADATERTRVGGLLALGAASHLLADALLLKASARSYLVFWPVSKYVPPTPGLYLSTDLWPSIVTGLLALGTWILVRRGAFDRT